MSKQQKHSREDKKKPQLTQKEKRAQKNAKKSHRDATISDIRR